MIRTSCFARMKDMSDKQKAVCISIARYLPKGINILQYLKAAPKDQVLWRYKKDWDKEAYIRAYERQLAELDVDEVWADLDGKILLCHEKPGDFCHRHLLAQWFRDAGYRCEEIS